MGKIKVAFFGTPIFAIPILEGLVENYDVVLVVTQPDKPVGRSKELKPSPIKEFALKHNIKVLTPAKIKEEYQEIITEEIDIIVTCAYGQIIPDELLSFPRLGCINVHASLLPELRGGAPIHKAIINGYEKTGITIMYMASKMDAGDIISQIETPITDEDNVGTLHDRLSQLGSELLLNTLPSIIDGTNARAPQDEDLVTYAYNIQREEEKLNFNKNTIELVNQIRGLYPWPLAYMLIDNKETKVLKAKVSNKCMDGEVGTIIHADEEGLYIKTIDGVLKVLEIKPFSKKETNIKDYLNGKDKNSLIGRSVR
ncbi:MAG: methionyl-tRNA formyltransferase [Mollicutes bacterium]|nr:methionyl-tRNA formyltransferase [Mollicutes bacterium]